MKQSDVFEAPIVYCRKNKDIIIQNPNYCISSIHLQMMIFNDKRSIRPNQKFRKWQQG